MITRIATRQHGETLRQLKRREVGYWLDLRRKRHTEPRYERLLRGRWVPRWWGDSRPHLPTKRELRARAKLGSP